MNVSSVNGNDATYNHRSITMNTTRINRKIAKLEAEAAALEALNKANERLGIQPETIDDKINRGVVQPAKAVGGLIGRVIGSSAHLAGKAVATTGSSLLFVSSPRHREAVRAEIAHRFLENHGLQIVEVEG
jgi:hypothetical protein